MVRHVSREVNLVVDQIAKMVSVDLKRINVLTTAPTNLLKALESNKTIGAFILSM